MTTAMAPEPTVKRTPLWAMSDAQLVFIAEDDTETYERRQVALLILIERAS